MGFANLSLLGLGALLLAVPLLLLLINRKRQVIPWAAYYWMQLAAAKKKKRVRVTEWLKLVSKLLLILAAALFLARPYLGFSGGGHTLVIIDTSLSMQTRDGNATRLDAARTRAAEIARETPGRVSLATFDGRLTVIARAQTDGASLERLLPTVLPGAGSGTGRELVAQLMGMDDLAEYSSIVVIGDFQRQYYGDGAVITELSERLPEGCRVTLAPIDGRTGVANLGLLEWRLAPEGLHAGRENTIEVRVQNFGASVADNTAITLLLDGAAIDRAAVTLAPGEARWVALSCPLADAAAHDLTLALPTDDYPLDDQLRIVVAPKAPLNVLAVVPEQAGDERFSRDVFLRSALLAVGGDAAWHYQRVSPLQALHEDFANYDLVALFGVPLRADDPMTPLLRAHLEAGRGAIAFADPEVAGFWSGFGVASAPADLTERSVDPQQLTGGYLDFLRADGMSPSQIHVFRALPLADAPLTEARLFVAGQAAPLVRSVAVGAGRLICVGFQPAPGFTDIYYNPNFVQFTQRMAWEAMGLHPDQGVVGATMATLPLPNLTPNHRYGWSAEGEAVRPVALLDRDGVQVLDLEEPAAGGFYTITADGEPLLRFGYSPSREDSDVEPTGPRLREAATRRVGVADTASGGAGGATRELAWLGMILLLAALVLENYAHLARRT